MPVLESAEDKKEDEVSTALILMYHHLAPENEPVSADRRPYVLEEDLFRRQVDAIAATGNAVASIGSWVAGRRCDAAVPLTIVPTFDDGEESNFTRAFPRLAERGMSATFFVTAGRIGEPGYLSREQTRALHRAGMEIGSHTLTHRPPSLLNDEELRHELVESKHRLEDLLGAPVVSLSSPTGFFNPRMSDLARQAGYTSLCGGRIALAGDNVDLFALPRVPIKSSMSMNRFTGIVDVRPGSLVRLRLQQIARNGLKRILGYETYLRWRKRALSARRER